MDLREQILATLDGAEIFPVPFDIWEGGIYPNLAADLCRHYCLAENDHEGLLQSLGAAIRWGGPAYTGPALSEAPLDVPAAFPHKKITRNVWGTLRGIESYTSVVERPMAGVETVEEVEAYPWPSPDWFDYGRLGWFTVAADDYLPVAQWAAKHENVARLVGGWNPVFSRVMDLFGMEQGLMNLAARPDLIQATVEQIGAFYIEYYERLATACEGHADIMAFGDDFAGQSDLLLHPDQWRELFLPLWRRLYAIAHRHGMKTMMHMCGAVRPVLGDLVEAGLDIYQGLQVTAAGIVPEELKVEFGSSLSFYGGVDTQGLLPGGSAGQVRREVHGLVQTMGRGGRFILSSMHFLMDDVPYQNVLAMIEANKIA